MAQLFEHFRIVELKIQHPLNSIFKFVMKQTARGSKAPPADNRDKKGLLLPEMACFITVRPALK